jgi:hypothetical protein
VEQPLVEEAVRCSAGLPFSLATVELPLLLVGKDLPHECADEEDGERSVQRSEGARCCSAVNPGSVIMTSSAFW